MSWNSRQSYRKHKYPGMKIYIKKPVLTDAEKRAQDWVIRAKSPKVPLPKSWQNITEVKSEKADTDK